MSNIRIDKSKATKKWAPVLENMGVIGEDRLDWMSEYAEYHSINENAYVNASNVSGMGGVISSQPSTLAGQTLGSSFNTANSFLGSGDVGQNLLPVAMKIAAQTIGLDLVAVKPTPGPKIDLLFIDFRYDDNHLGASDERPQVFKINTAGGVGGTNSLLYTALTSNGYTGAPTSTSLTTGGLTTGPVYVALNATGTASFLASSGVAATMSGTLPANLEGVAEFLGFSRIDGYPMFRAFRQANTAHTSTSQTVAGANGNWFFDTTRNTFGATTSMASQIRNVAGVATGLPTIELVSALEDHIPGFSSNWTQGGSGFTGNYPMDRDADDKSYSGVIGPKISSKTIAVGTIEVSSALRRTEIEDIKANTGMDIVQKMESILVNELSQTISKQIVAKIFEMGTLNRTTAPFKSASETIFDLNTSYATSVGGETTHAVQRKLITKIAHASNYIATEGRVGPAQYLITNGGLAAALQDIAGYTINPVKSKMNASGQLYPVGSIGDISIYVDPYMRYNDNRIVLGRKNNPDQPGIVFVPYLMAQSISVISEATFAPRMLLRSRYAVAEIGWFPQKQFMLINVNDAGQYLN
jgi:hypothetical protein